MGAKQGGSGEKVTSLKIRGGVFISEPVVGLKKR